MAEQSFFRDEGRTSQDGIMGRGADSERDEVLTIAAPIELQDRIAAARFAYSDLFAAGRRRLLHVLAWVAIVLLLVTGFSSWQESGHQGIGTFASRFIDDLFGLGGLPILVVALPLLVYYAIQPAVVRSRLRRWCRDERLDQPVDATYRFERGGLAVTLPGRRTVLACSRIKGVVRTPEHLFIALKDIEDVFALPLRVLSEEQAARIEAWGASCHAGVAEADHGLLEREARSDQQPLLTSRFQLNEADRAVALAWQMERPGMRRRRRRGFILAFLVTAFIVPLIFGFLWLLDPARVPFRYAFPLFIELSLGFFWKYVLGFWAIIAAIILLHPWSRRRHAYKLAQRMHQRVQAYEYELRLFEDSLEVWQDGWCNRFEAAGFEGMERQGEHLILLRGEGEPLILPLRALDGDKLAIFERIADRRGGGEGHRPEAGA
jgi:hypothetical protein